MSVDAMTWRWSAGAAWVMDRPWVVAIVNVTPDSFYDGGVLTDAGAAAAWAERAVALGASGLDVGGESTRPGAARVDAPTQRARVVPVIEAIRRRVGTGVMISVDTTSASVAEAALGAGADAINDVSGAEDDAGMLPLAARAGCGVILMHRRVKPAEDRYSDRYDAEPAYGGRGGAGVVGAVAAYLASRLEAAVRAGVGAEAVMLDPGLGFGKSVGQNAALMAGTGAVLSLGRPVLSALSRKSFVGRMSGLGASAPSDRLAGTLGLSVAHLALGARVFRVHDAGPVSEALRAAWAVMGPREEAERGEGTRGAGA